MTHLNCSLSYSLNYSQICIDADEVIEFAAIAWQANGERP